MMTQNRLENLMTEDKEYDRGKRKIVLVGLGPKAYYYNYYWLNASGVDQLWEMGAIFL